MNFSLKAKEQIFLSPEVRYFLILLALLFQITTTSRAQERPVRPPRTTLPVKQDSAAIPSDTLSTPTDTLLNKSNTTPAKGDIETTIDYAARDSIRASLDGKIVWLYGEARIVYGKIELKAEEIVIDYGKNTLTAHGKRDSLGRRVGYPIFKDGEKLYETKDIIYNFKTRRARISEIVTEESEGFIHAQAAFKNERDEVLSTNTSYTTCNLEHPHFRIRSTKTKAIPKDKIVSGPFYMEFNDIPLPLGFLFGMFPSKQESSSGVVLPSYGEERRRGFNLQRGGYFFDISEYMNLLLTGDIYSKGGHALHANSSYIKRYKYTGGVTFSYSKNPTGESDKIEEKQFSKDFSLAWSHSPQSKGTGRFSASVNAASATYNRYNNLLYGTPGDLSTSSLNNITAKLRSNVNYSKTFPNTPIAVGLNFTHEQDLLTKLVNLQLPALRLNVSNIYPFQRVAGGEGALSKLSISYSMSAENRITNNLGRVGNAVRDSIAPFTFNTLSTFFKNGKNGMRHSIPLSFSFKALRFFTVSPSVSYEEKWYLEKLDWGRDNTGQIVKVDTVKGFNRIANYSTGLGFNTRVYGMYMMKNPNSKVKAIRHVMTLSPGFSYRPEFGNNHNYFEKFTNGETEVFKSRHEGFVYGGSDMGESASASFSLGNNLEMKVKGEKDTVARKVMLLNNLSLGSGYNFLADSFKLSPIGISANTDILDNQINLNLSATLDPYTYVTTTNSETLISTETRSDRLVWENLKLGRITSASLGVNTNLNPKAREKQAESREKIAKSDLPEQEKEFFLRNPDSYVDFEIPWTLALGYTLNYSHGTNTKSSITQTLQMSGTLKITDKWMVNYTTGYHFEEKNFTMTSLGIARDLHCWQMNLNWVPFGHFQHYNFSIRVKASVLQDLKMERRKPFLDQL